MSVPRKGVGPHIASTIEPFSQVFGNSRSVPLYKCSCRDLSRDSPVLTSSFGKRREGKALPLTRAVRSSANVYLKRVGDRTVLRIESSDRLGASGALGLCFVAGGHLLLLGSRGVPNRRQLLLPGRGDTQTMVGSAPKIFPDYAAAVRYFARSQRRSSQLPIMGAIQRDRSCHDVISSRSPAVTTYTRPPSRRTGSSPDAARRYAAARLMPSSVAARGTASSNGRSLNTWLSNLIHLRSAVSLCLRTASRTKLG